MSVSLFVLCFSLCNVAVPAARLAQVKDAASSPPLDGNMRRVTAKQASALAAALDDDPLDDVAYLDELDDAFRRGKKNAKAWDHWGKWSPCSVTCGVGKMVRWRHCVSDACAPGEKEAQIKTCTLSPCQ